MGFFEDENEQFDQVVESTGEFARVDALAGHLLILFPTGYVEHSPTRFSVPGKKSDAIVLDVVDLDDVDENGNPGKLYRNSWWRGAQLIMSLRTRIGGKVLGRLGRGVPKNGMNPPWVIQDMSGDDALKERARAWGRVHTNFMTTPFQPPQAVTAPAPAYSPPAAPAPQAQQPPRFPVGQPQGYPQQGGYNQQPQGFYDQGGAPQGYPQQQPQQGPPPGYAGGGYDAQQQPGYPQPAYQQQPQNGYTQPPPPPANVPQEGVDMLAMMRERRQANPYPPQGYPTDPPF